MAATQGLCTGNQVWPYSSDEAHLQAYLTSYSLCLCGVCILIYQHIMGVAQSACRICSNLRALSICMWPHLAIDSCRDCTGISPW